MTNEYAKSVANEMLNQLGGGRFVFMVGAKYLSYNQKGSDVVLSMKIGRNKTSANVFRMTYLPSEDLYKMVILRQSVSRKTFQTTEKVIAERTGVYFDMVQDVFTEMTGLYTHL